MNKRGQVTIFIIVGVVLFILIVGIFIVVNNSRENELSNEYFQRAEIQEKVESIKFGIEDCIDSSSKGSLVLVAFQGGYYDKPEKNFDYYPFFFPYYYYEGELLIPTLERIEFELGKSISDNFEECLSDIESPNFKITNSDAETLTKITSQNVYVEVNSQVTLESNGNKLNLETSDFSKNYNSSLYEIYEIAEYITNSHLEDSEYYCVNCVAEMAEERDLYVHMFPNVANDDDITGVLIYENRTQIGDPYGFVFLNKYTGNEKTPKLNNLI